ncbi:MAG TPA: thiamine phosphate synthase [Methanoregulaceae archaeon]|nr:thiamine phosphate synthase [Methanoregulaceae archaeon]
MAYDLYIVTDETLSHGLSHEEIAKKALEGGADVIQLRDKTAGGRRLLETALRIRVHTRQSGALFIVNDRVDIALASGADGVHLGKEDMPLSSARIILPRPYCIGISVESADEARTACRDGADYVAVSPVFTTGSKKDAGPGLGTDMIREIRRSVSIPVIAIGGIGLHNVRDVIDAGADGVAVISAVVSSPDITRASRDLKSRIAECKRKKVE